MTGEPAELIDHEEEGDSSSLTSAGFVMTAGDITIFRLLYEFRFLRCEHLSALTRRSPKRLHRRLLKLIGLGYLTSIRLPQQKHIYGLGKAAMPILVEQGIADPDVLAQRVRVHELKELFLKHEMMIVDIHVAFALAAGVDRQQVVAWREGKDLFDSVAFTDQHGHTRLPIRPDAFFTIEDARRPAGANHAHYFLEADRSTATQTRFQEKIIAYWQYLEQGLHVKKYGIKNFRVLTVTLTHKRAENLCTLAAAVLPERARKYYLFTGEKFSHESPLSVYGSVYLSPRSPGADRYPLVPPPQSTPPNQSVVV